MVTNLVPLHPSSTLVNVTERAEVHLVHLLAQRAPSGLLSGSFTSDCETCIGNGDTPGLLRIIFRDEGALTSLFSIDPPEESVSAFTLLSSLVDRVPNEDEQAALITEIFNVLVSNTTFDAQRRIAMLAALFNLRPSGSEKCTFLSKIVDMCASQAPSMLIEGQPLASMIEPNRLVELLSFWEVTPEQRRDIYGSVANAIESVEGSSKRGQTALLLYLRSFTDEVSSEVFCIPMVGVSFTLICSLSCRSILLLNSKHCS